ncbi:hypothetical protein NPIL_637911 [Nephila pilipes]|uniref:Uncharacterized protein n=1 Tax=Nephila pilipes TaxID=299642 RepID=A0A8X6TSZ0_NEPPI|nr:hypothetical protein NPIL_490101 [Nephila pilipes]GFT96674.1 hypothetical protein NPIL_637911 [Nephila pilipes]
MTRSQHSPRGNKKQSRFNNINKPRKALWNLATGEEWRTTAIWTDQLIPRGHWNRTVLVPVSASGDAEMERWQALGGSDCTQGNHSAGYRLPLLRGEHLLLLLLN